MWPVFVFWNRSLRFHPYRAANKPLDVLLDLGRAWRFLEPLLASVVIYYAWGDYKYGIHRCGALTESGHLALRN